MVLLRRWCGTLISMWYFEEGGVVLLRGWCGTFKKVVWYFEVPVVLQDFVCSLKVTHVDDIISV